MGEACTRIGLAAKRSGTEYTCRRRTPATSPALHGTARTARHRPHCTASLALHGIARTARARGVRVFTRPPRNHTPSAQSHALRAIGRPECNWPP